MMVTEADEEAITLADLLERLGVSAERVIAYPPPGSGTEEDVVRLMEARRKRLCELIDGVLIEKTAGFMESVLAGAILSPLLNFVRTHNLGIVTGADGAFKVFPGRVRIPDVAFFSWDRIPGRRIPKEPIPQLAPDLAIEVLSPDNTLREMELKRHDYFRVGVIEHWQINPLKRTATIYRSPDESSIVNEDGIVEGSGLLLGFTLPLKALFAELDEQGT